MQEVLLGGHLYQQILKDRLRTQLLFLKKLILKSIEINGGSTIDETEFSTIVRKMSNISSSMEAFLATGNINTTANLGLMQSTGLVIQAENINRMRYMSHFR